MWWRWVTQGNFPGTTLSQGHRIFCSGINNTEVISLCIRYGLGYKSSSLFEEFDLWLKIHSCNSGRETDVRISLLLQHRTEEQHDAEKAKVLKTSFSSSPSHSVHIKKQIVIRYLLTCWQKQQRARIHAVIEEGEWERWGQTKELLTNCHDLLKFIRRV